MEAKNGPKAKPREETPRVKTRKSQPTLGLLGIPAVCLVLSGCGAPPAVTRLLYSAHAGAQPVTAATLQETIGIMRRRLRALGIGDATIRLAGAKEIVVALPHASNLARAEVEVGKTDRLYFYDWEPNVIGSGGKPATREPPETEPSITGGTQAGESPFGLSEYKAVLRAAKRAPILRQTDTTWSPGCTPAQVGGCVYGTWYLLDTARERVLRGPEETEQNLYAHSYKPSAGAKTMVVRVNPGTVLVQARAVEAASGKITQPSPNSYYVLNDAPVLTGSDITHPQQGFDEGAGGTRAPDVNIGFTSQGKPIFERITREIARRGQETQLPGMSREEAMQHFAIVLDGQLITVPSIDYTQYPEGIDAAQGSQISGEFTVSSAQELADELQSGALPIELELVKRWRSR
jgi:SecD/SecF fusion protein